MLYFFQAPVAWARISVITEILGFGICLDFVLTASVFRRKAWIELFAAFIFGAKWQLSVARGKRV